MTRQPFLISGEASGPAVSPRPQARTSRLLRVVVFVWLLGGLGFLLFRLASGKHSAQESKPEPAKTSVTAISAEDLLHHMDSVNSELETAAARLRRAEDHITRSIPGVNRNYLFVEKSHLENALAVTAAARQELEHCRQEFELVLNSLKKEHQLQ